MLKQTDHADIQPASRQELLDIASRQVGEVHALRDEYWRALDSGRGDRAGYLDARLRGMENDLMATAEAILDTCPGDTEAHAVEVTVCQIGGALADYAALRRTLEHGASGSERLVNENTRYELLSMLLGEQANEAGAEPGAAESSEDHSDLRPGKWFDQQTDRLLTADALRKIHRRDKIHAEKRGKRWYYRVSDVIRLRPELKNMLSEDQPAR